MRQGQHTSKATSKAPVYLQYHRCDSSREGAIQNHCGKEDVIQNDENSEDAFHNDVEGAAEVAEKEGMVQGDGGGATCMMRKEGSKTKGKVRVKTMRAGSRERATYHLDDEEGTTVGAES
jgi:hypothetical protein